MNRTPSSSDGPWGNPFKLQARTLSARRAATVILLALGAAACSPAVDQRPNVILVTLDTTRLDDLGCYGGPTSTPGLDRLAADGVLFERAYSVAFGTTPSHATLFTGAHARRHGVYDNHTILEDRHVTLAEVMHDAGYATAAFVSGRPLVSAIGLAQGFEHYDDGPFVDGRRPAEATTDRALEWLASERHRPFFAWVHYYDPHQPYAPAPALSAGRMSLALSALFGDEHDSPRYLRGPELPAQHLPAIDREARRRYRGQIERMDSQLARLLANLDHDQTYDATMIVVVADHGENFLDRGVRLAFDHDGLFAEVSRLPLVVKPPASRGRGAHRDALVGNLDIAPTILDLADLDAPPSWQGLSLGEHLDAGDTVGRTHLILEGAHHIEIAVRTRRWLYRRLIDPAATNPDNVVRLSYVGGSSAELYDTAASPREGQPLTPMPPAETAALGELIERFLATPAAVAPPRLDDTAHEDALRALGYVR